MTINDPYSKSEIDAKLETVGQKIVTLETKIDGKLDLILSLMSEKFSATDKQIADLRGIVTATGIGLLLVLAGVILPIAWTLWANLTHPVK